MVEYKIKTRVSNLILITLACTMVMVGIGFFTFQFAASLLSTASSGTTVTNEPVPKGSAFYPVWLTWKISGLQNFYGASALNNGGNYVIMTKNTANIQSLANGIATGRTSSVTIQNIMNWMHNNSRFGLHEGNASNNYCNNVGKWSRTADQILQSRCATGCTDWTTAFIALARAKGLSASAVDLVSDRWITESQQVSCIKSPEYGHYVSDVYTENGWVLVDPTNNNFTVYKNNDSSNFALMRFDAYNPGAPLTSYGTGYNYRVLHRGIDAWDTGIRSQNDWTVAVKKEYGLSNLPNCH